MLKQLENEKLETWKSNFSNNLDLEILTKSSIVDIKILKDFINQAEPLGCEAVRIYFTRYSVAEGVGNYPGYIEKIKNADFSQVSLAFVPVKNFNAATLAGEDIVSDTDEVLTLAFCHPSEYGSNGNESGTGHCPPNCRK